MTETLMDTRTDRVRLQSRSATLLEVKPEATAGSIQDHLRRKLGEGTLSVGEVEDLVQGHALEMQKYRDY